MLRLQLLPAAARDLTALARLGKSASRVSGGSLVAATFGIACAHAIVSDRHLQGVSALECDLESSPSGFRLLVNTRKHTLQLEQQVETISYEEISDTTLRFQLVLPESSGRSCEIQFPAGSLVCERNDGKTEFGFCLPVH
jgi:hypothetical protein